MFALAAWRGFSVLALGVCSRAGQKHYLVSVNLDVILLAAMLDGILCSVWSSYATPVGGGSETAQSWWLSWALAIAVAGRLTGTLLSTLLGRQCDSELLAYKRWELILVARKWKLTVHRFGLLSESPLMVETAAVKTIGYSSEEKGKQKVRQERPSDKDWRALDRRETRLKDKTKALQQRIGRKIGQYRETIGGLEEKLRSKDLSIETLSAQLRKLGAEAGHEAEKLKTDLATRSVDIARTERDEELAAVQRQKAELQGRVDEQSVLLQGAMMEQQRMESRQTVHKAGCSALEAAEGENGELKEANATQAVLAERTAALDQATADKASLQASDPCTAIIDERCSSQAAMVETVQQENMELKQGQQERDAELEALREQLRMSREEADGLRAQLQQQDQTQVAEDGLTAHLPPQDGDDDTMGMLSFSGAIHSLESLDSVDSVLGGVIVERSALTAATPSQLVDTLADHIPPIDDASVASSGATTSDGTVVPVTEDSEDSEVSEASVDSATLWSGRRLQDSVELRSTQWLTLAKPKGPDSADDTTVDVSLEMSQDLAPNASMENAQGSDWDIDPRLEAYIPPPPKTMEEIRREADEAFDLLNPNWDAQRAREEAELSSDSIHFGYIPPWLLGNLAETSFSGLSDVSSGWSVGEEDDSVELRSTQWLTLAKPKGPDSADDTTVDVSLEMSQDLAPNASMENAQGSDWDIDPRLEAYIPPPPKTMEEIRREADEAFDLLNPNWDAQRAREEAELSSDSIHFGYIPPWLLGNLAETSFSGLSDVSSGWSVGEEDGLANTSMENAQGSDWDINPRLEAYIPPPPRTMEEIRREADEAFDQWNPNWDAQRAREEAERSSDSIHFGYIPPWLLGNLADTSFSGLSDVSSSWSVAREDAPTNGTMENAAGSDGAADVGLEACIHPGDDLAAHLPPIDGAQGA
ncbi:hypothetical protein POSPLADRAFT_1032156 [Postia placenta MAD-698-R-SB12]|uniref:Uncharacterized protein n=1 Tax=Postia placenta MAD-698-R-SB12 TaxID=670580 RepID=A0A1X6N9X9_9APHY|nr:hypothetical protein POSPLADRAFT_1032156 [Postia placenta MAD-698-R-SB12]OSX65374.1 hypothetical protein POSPLADRAFT_1032156 [Postia placenta MAD-698-R-SB12]